DAALSLRAADPPALEPRRRARYRRRLPRLARAVALERRALLRARRAGRSVRARRARVARAAAGRAARDGGRGAAGSTPERSGAARAGVGERRAPSAARSRRRARGARTSAALGLLARRADGSG